MPSQTQRKRAPARPSSPLRMCLGCRERQHPTGLIRFVADADGTLQIDRRQRLPGRGAYLHLRRACLDRAVKGRALSRNLGVPSVDDPDALWQRMVEVGEERFLERLGLARRAGQVVSGTEPVRRAMKRDEVRLLCVASDASPTTRRTLAENARRKGIVVAVGLEGARLAKAVGMDYVSALVVTGQPFASELLEMVKPLDEMQAPGGSNE